MGAVTSDALTAQADTQATPFGVRDSHLRTWPPGWWSTTPTLHQNHLQSFQTADHRDHLRRGWVCSKVLGALTTRASSADQQPLAE